MFEWYKKQRLAEQVKFFGGKTKGFVSCYAKQVKPRIRVPSDNIDRVRISLNTGYGIGYSKQMTHQQPVAMANLQYHIGIQNPNAGMFNSQTRADNLANSGCGGIGYPLVGLLVVLTRSLASRITPILRGA